jgi:hypothetical protein
VEAPHHRADPLEAFYSDLLFELSEFMQTRKPTVTGFGPVIKRVALAHGIPLARDLPLPRYSRAERQDRAPWPDTEAWGGAPPQAKRGAPPSPG